MCKVKGIETYSGQKTIEDDITVSAADVKLVIKEVFSKFHYNNLTHRQWIRHLDNRTNADHVQHNKCLIYHEKGTRGKGKGIKVQWQNVIETDIES